MCNKSTCFYKYFLIKIITDIFLLNIIKKKVFYKRQYNNKAPENRTDWRIGTKDLAMVFESFLNINKFRIKTSKFVFLYT